MLTVGKTYIMTGIHVRCVGFTKKGYAKMQSLGMTAGKSPTNKDISKYSKVTRDFTDEWKGVIRKFRLPTSKQVHENRLIGQAIVEGIDMFNSLGADYRLAWLGDSDSDSCSNYADGVGHTFNTIADVQNDSYVIAPIFNLDMDKVIVQGDKIEKKCYDNSCQLDDNDILRNIRADMVSAYNRQVDTDNMTGAYEIKKLLRSFDKYVRSNMNRERAADVLQSMLDAIRVDKHDRAECEEALQFAIEILNEEPCESAMDKIKDELSQLYVDDDDIDYDTIEACKRIIDGYASKIQADAASESDE